MSGVSTRSPVVIRRSSSGQCGCVTAPGWPRPTKIVPSPHSALTGLTSSSRSSTAATCVWPVSVRPRTIITFGTAPGDAVEDVVLADDHLVDAPTRSSTTAQHQRAGADDVDPAGVHERQRRPLVAGHREQAVGDLGARRSAVMRAWWIALRVVRRQAERHRRDRRDRAGQADEGARLGQRHRLRRRASSAGLDVGPGRGDLRRRSAGRRAGAARSSGRSRRRPSAPPSTASVAEHELGRAAADVDDEERRLRRRAAQLAGRAGEGQLGLLVAGDHLRLDAEDRSRTPATNSSRFSASRVAEVATKRTRSAPSSLDHRRRSRRSAANVRSSASGASRPVRSTPWPSRTISIRRSTSVSGRRLRGRRRRPAAGSSWCRSRSRRPGSSRVTRCRTLDARPAAPPLAAARPAPRRRAGSRPGPRRASARPARAGT